MLFIDAIGQIIRPHVAKSRVLRCVDRMSFHTASMLPLGSSGRAASVPAERGAAASCCREPSAGCSGDAADGPGPAGAEAIGKG